MQEFGKLQMHESYQLLCGAELTGTDDINRSLLDLIIVQTVVIIIIMFIVLLFCACVYCTGHC